MTHENDDTEGLDATLRQWRVPQPSPWFKTRVTQHLARETAAAAHGVAWPLAPLKLAAASVAVAVIGVGLGLSAPGEQSFVLDEDGAAEMEVAIDVAIDDVAEADMIDEMW